MMGIKHFYPRSPCGERLWPGLLARPFFIISIHALLAESDARRDSRQQPAGISIHALLAESDGRPKLLKSRRCVFLSTLSLRRATFIFSLPLVLILLFLSTLSLRRATTWQRGSRVTYVISIHALLAESDRVP